MRFKWRNYFIYWSRNYCVCVKRKTLCNCLCPSSSSCDSASLFRNIGEFGAQSYFTDHRKDNSVISSCKMEIFWVYSFSRQVVAKRNSLDKDSHLFIRILLKKTLSRGQKPVYTVKILESKQIACGAVVYFA